MQELIPQVGNLEYKVFPCHVHALKRKFEEQFHLQIERGVISSTRHLAGPWYDLGINNQALALRYHMNVLAELLKSRNLTQPHELRRQSVAVLYLNYTARGILGEQPDWREEFLRQHGYDPKKIRK